MNVEKLNEFVKLKIITEDEKEFIIKGFDLGFRFEINEQIVAGFDNIAHAYTSISLNKKELNGRNKT